MEDGHQTEIAMWSHKWGCCSQTVENGESAGLAIGEGAECLQLVTGSNYPFGVGHWVLPGEGVRRFSEFSPLNGIQHLFQKSMIEPTFTLKRLCRGFWTATEWCLRSQETSVCCDLLSRWSPACCGARCARSSPQCPLHSAPSPSTSASELSTSRSECRRKAPHGSCNEVASSFQKLSWTWMRKVHLVQNTKTKLRNASIMLALESGGAWGGGGICGQILNLEVFKAHFPWDVCILCWPKVVPEWILKNQVSHDWPNSVQIGTWNIHNRNRQLLFFLFFSRTNSPFLMNVNATLGNVFNTVSCEIFQSGWPWKLWKYAKVKRNVQQWHTIYGHSKLSVINSTHCKLTLHFGQSGQQHGTGCNLSPRVPSKLTGQQSCFDYVLG